MKLFKRQILISIFSIFIFSCSTQKDIKGVYKSNFAALGFFMTEINLNDNHSFDYKFEGDLSRITLTGTYEIKSNKLYLKFSKPKGEIESQNDTLSIIECLTGNFHNYDLKTENGIEYHLKYLIKTDKILSYRVDNEKLVRKAKKYSDKKRFIFFGPSWQMKRSYLKKMN